MRHTMGESIFDRLFRKRQKLIFLFKKGDISKREYIEETYAYLQETNAKPFKRVDNFNKAIYNYQFYNMMAKHCNLKAREIKRYNKHPEIYQRYLRKVNYYYNRKDYSTLRAVEILEFFNVEAYYIRVSSSNLKDSLFEIIFSEHEDIILHSKSQWLLERLKVEGVFKDEVKKSLIANYVNEKY